MMLPEPPNWLRLAAVTVTLAGIAVLSLSDRAPRLLSGLLRAVVGIVPFGSLGVSTFVVSALRSLPGGSDALGHFALWAVVGLLASSLVRAPLARFNLLVGLVALSALIEVGQAVATWSRSASMSDLTANALGVAAGYLVFATTQRLRQSALFSH